MAGGRSSYFKSDLDDLKQKLRASDESTENSEYEAHVASLLASQLTAFNDRDDEAIDRHLTEIKRALEKELEDTVDLMFGGSVAKQTYVDGLSDIDSLVILDNCDLAGGTPDEAKEYFARRLRERFPKTKVKEGNLAVTVRFADAEIQLLPAISCERNVKIADSSGHRWSEINPRGFTKVLRETNQRSGKKVIPIIKLAKGIIANLPGKHRISGYHAESLAVEIFKNYNGDLTPKAMLRHYFHESSRRVQQPIRDRTGQSVHVDDYLGASNSLERKIVSDAFDRVSRRMSNADSAGSVEEWSRLFGE
jgi:predicted nucleotidyltransferase